MSGDPDVLGAPGAPPTSIGTHGLHPERQVSDIAETVAPSNPVVARLAEITWQVVDGDFTALRRIVEASGGTWSEEITEPSGTLFAPPPVPHNVIAHCAHGMNVGIPIHGDPVGAFVQVAFCIAGQRWTELPEFMEAMRTVQREWSARTKVTRKAKEAASA